jgi:tetratricopeptide (TPR) repeat protein
MGIVQNLSALALHKLIGRAPGSEAVGQGVGADLAGLFNAQSQQITRAVQQSNEAAWRALEVALVGESLWERTKVSLRRSGDQAFRQQVRAFLDAVALEPDAAAEGSPEDAEFRQQCLRELRSARRAGQLTGGDLDLRQLADQIGHLAAIADTGRLQDAEWEVLEQIAAELAQSGFAKLGRLITLRPPQGISILVAAARFFLRRQIEGDRTLVERFAFAQTEMPSAAQEAGFSALVDALGKHGRQLERLLDEVIGGPPQARGEALPLQTELQRLGPAIQSLGREVVQLLDKHQLERRELWPSDSLSIRGEPERQHIREVMGRFQDLPDDQRRQLPALLNAVAKLEVVAGEFDAAQRDFQEAAALVPDPKAQAETLHNAYRAALEKRDWTAALGSLLQAAKLDPERFAPLPLDEYEPESILGAGGFGVSFMCRHRASGEEVLVKALQADHLEREVAEVFREAEILQELDQPAILRPRAWGHADEAKLQPFLVLDYFEGLSLADYVRVHGPLTAEDLLAIARPVADALRAAHARGVLHRGLKPSNVLVRRSPDTHVPAGRWEVKLIDVGLSLKPEVLHAASSGTAVRSRTCIGASVAGTLDYAAPEKLGRLEGTAVAPHSDVYSFGKTCYFALLKTPEPDDEEKEGLHPFWRKLLGGCTARGVAKRLPDFGAVIERLDQFQAEAGPAPRPATPAPVRADVPEVPAPADSRIVPTPFQRGVACHSRGEYEQAISEFSEALRLDPNNALAYANRGDAYRLKGDLERAIADFGEALRLNPSNPLAYINQGIAYRLKGDYDRAVADYTEALRLDPNNALAYNNRGNAYADKGEHDKAIADYSEALRLDPQYTWAYHNRGNAYADKGEPDNAIADFTRALRLEPSNAVAHTNRGDAYRLKGELDRAIADYTEALRLDPNHTLAYTNRGDVYRLKGEYDRSIADFTEALGLDPANALVYRNRGIAYRHKGDHDKAITDFTQALRIDPQYALAYNNRGNVFSSKGEYDKAIADFSEAIRVEPKLAVAYMNRGLAYAKKGNLDAAIADCKSAAKFDPKLATAHFIRGAAHATKGEHDKAIVSFTRALQIDPKYALAYNDRGLAYANRGDYDKAVADYSEALKVDPKYALAYANRGIALRLKGDNDRAIADFTRASRLDPKLALAYYHRGLAYTAKEDFDRAIADFTLAHRLEPQNAEVFSRRDEAIKAKNEYLKKRKERRQREVAARAEEERRQREAAAYFIRAKTHADRGEHDDAIIDYTEALRLDSKDALAYYHRGLAYVARQDFDLAIADFTESLKLHPKNAEVWYHRGLAYRVRHKYDKAIADFTQALKIDPLHAEAGNRREEAARVKAERPKVEDRHGAGHVNKAQSSFDKGEFEHAIAQYTTALKHDPNNRDTYQARALAYEQTGDLDKALADYTEVLRLDPRDPHGFQFRGSVYHRRGDFDRAIADFTQALKLEPESAFAYYNRGLAFVAKDEYPKAIADFTRALKLDPQYAVAFGYRGQAYRLNGEYDKAIADCNEALRLDPQYAVAYRNRGLAYAAKGEHARAKLDYEESIRLDPTLAPT